MNNSAVQCRACRRPSPSFSSYPVHNGILYPEIGEHAVIDGIIKHIACYRKETWVRQNIFPRIITEIFINIVSVCRFKLGKAIQNLAGTPQVKVEPDTIIDRTVKANPCNKGFLNSKSQFFYLLLKIRRNAIMA